MLKAIARLFLKVAGWDSEGGLPVEKRFVLIAAPHTSNWDLALLLALAETYDVRVSWMGKHTLFRGPMGRLMTAVGGIPVRRDRRNSLVKQMAAEFEKRDELVLVVPSEGTRGYTPHWKSGFYHIATEAGVPIVMGFLDYAHKRGGFGPALLPSGDIRADMDEFRAFYSDKTGRHPELFGEIRLKEEM
jgi:1-acyl-sn-glycerol-3-phosphate acyltransferase